MEDDRKTLTELQSTGESLTAEMAKVIIGQRQVLDQMLIAMFAGGHCLLLGVPGLAKTLMVSTLAKLLDLQFHRIQFTPDLMPSDITGTEVLQEDRSTGQRSFRFIPGPVFANVVLADEINRAPPKTQAALLEAMQERQVTVGGERRALPHPFFVLATQNPIEQEGTYPLPEAQLDRFMMNVWIDYPSEAEELEMVLQTTGDLTAQVESCVRGEALERYIRLVRRIPISQTVAAFAMRIARLSRPGTSSIPIVQKCVRWGAGPRATQFLVLGGKARAALQGRPLVTDDDIREVALPVLRHRLRLNFQAEAENISILDIIREIVEEASSRGTISSREAAMQVFRT